MDSDDENPLRMYEVSRLFGNWETPDGNNFFCEWYDDCPPCEDSIRGPCVCQVAVPGMSRMPTASAWVTPMQKTSFTTSPCRVFSLVCL